MTRITQASLDRMLADELRSDAVRAPMHEAMLRVPDRWVRGRRLASSSGRAFAVGGVMTFAVVATLAVLSALGAFGERDLRIGTEDVPADIGVPIDRLDLEPQPGAVWEGAELAIGPVVEVARGSADGSPFAFTVYRAASPSDVCLQVEEAVDRGISCGAMPGEGPSGGAFGVGAWRLGSNPSVVFGLVAPNVAEVRIETAAGGMTRAQMVSLAPADVNALLFFAFLPGATESSAWVALDADGNEIDRLEAPAPQPEPSGPVPTAADQAPAP